MSETEGLSAAQLRARKRQEKIKASASTRINKVVGTARGEEGADYMKSQPGCCIVLAFKLTVV
jgi:hypothetical protein